MTNTTAGLATESAIRTDRSGVGLLILRLALGATLLQAGLMKALDFDTTVGFMESDGWRLPAFATFLVTATEILSGAGLLLGLLTPLAACAAIGAMADAWAVNVAPGAFWSQPFNVPFLVAFGAAALLFTGAGEIALDHRLFGRSRLSPRLAWTLVIVGLLVAVITWIGLNDSNPIHFTAPPS